MKVLSKDICSPETFPFQGYLVFEQEEIFSPNLTQTFDLAATITKSQIDTDDCSDIFHCFSLLQIHLTFSLKALNKSDGQQRCMDSLWNSISVKSLPLSLEGKNLSLSAIQTTQKIHKKFKMLEKLMS